MQLRHFVSNHFRDSISLDQKGRVCPWWACNMEIREYISASPPMLQEERTTAWINNGTISQVDRAPWLTIQVLLQSRKTNENHQGKQGRWCSILNCLGLEGKWKWITQFIHILTNASVYPWKLPILLPKTCFPTVLLSTASWCVSGFNLISNLLSKMCSYFFPGWDLQMTSWYKK